MLRGLPVPERCHHTSYLPAATCWWFYWQLCRSSNVHKLQIKDEDKNKTSLTFHLSTYSYNRVQFGLRTVFATFHYVLNTILSGVWWKRSLVSVDYMVTIYKNNCQHVKNIDEVLILLHQAGGTLKLPNGYFLEKNWIHRPYTYACSLRCYLRKPW